MVLNLWSAFLAQEISTSDVDAVISKDKIDAGAPLSFRFPSCSFQESLLPFNSTPASRMSAFRSGPFVSALESHCICIMRESLWLHFTSPGGPKITKVFYSVLYSSSMAYPSLDQYGAIRPAVGSHGSRMTRLMVISSAIFVCMCATAVLFSRSSTKTVEMESYSPDQKLNRLVQEFAEHGASMPVNEMEAKLDQWQNDPTTLLDLPENQHGQVNISVLLA